MERIILSQTHSKANDVSREYAHFCFFVYLFKCTVFIELTSVMSESFKVNLKFAIFPTDTI